MNVRVETADRVMRITLDRAAKLNAFTTVLRTGMIAALERAEADDAVRVVVLAGAGRGFSAGADIEEIRSRDETGIDIDGEFHRLFALVHRLPKPVIARWHGPVAGAALQLSLLCDLRIAATDARIGMTELNLGMPVLIGSRLLSAVVGDGMMRRMILYADFLSGTEAARFGLATEAVAPEALDARIAEVAAGLARRDPLAISITKAGWAEDTGPWFDAMFAQAARLRVRRPPERAVAR